MAEALTLKHWYDTCTDVTQMYEMRRGRMYPYNISRLSGWNMWWGVLFVAAGPQSTWIKDDGIRKRPNPSPHKTSFTQLQVI